MNIIAISDIHGILPKIEDKFDLLLICGDICPIYNHDVLFQENWLKDTFIKWVITLPYKNDNSKVIFIAGNHDFWFEMNGSNKDKIYNYFIKPTNHRLVYLHNETYDFEYFDEMYNYKVLHIFGTPYCKLFGNWAFMKSDDELSKYYDPIPSNIDILMSHDAPNINGLGCINNGCFKGRNAGNNVLSNFIKMKKPKYVLCGHIHSGNHNLDKMQEQNTFTANVSILDENYKIKYNPLIINFN